MKKIIRMTFFIDWQHTQQKQLVQNNSCERSNTLFANTNVSIIQSNRIVLLRNQTLKMKILFKSIKRFNNYIYFATKDLDKMTNGQKLQKILALKIPGLILFFTQP